MKKITFFLLIFIFTASFSSRADEGMWLPQLLQKLNESRMKSLGMKISAADIYSINKGSLKDAIVSLGGFCTAEVISSKGLILTNHHCGFDAIQNHTSLEKNYLRDGFWAKDNAGELPNKGLFVTFIVRIDDVSNTVMKGVNNNMDEKERQSLIDKNIAGAIKDVQKEATQDAFIRGFFEGNQYYLFVTETYRDIRLVGAPPSAIGNFGKDTDNWMWPRHTGEFSMFRIYASKENKPAEYAADNIPYSPKKSLKISLKGIKENDFTMVFGFPGRTMEYLPAIAVEQIRTVNDPAKIAIRDKALLIIDGYMRKDEALKIKYAAKYASIQNAYKKWQGEVLGLTKTNAFLKKKNYENIFQQRVNANAGLKQQYGNVLQNLAEAYKNMEPFGLGRDYYNELFSKIELYAIGMQLNSLVTAHSKGEAVYASRLKQVQTSINDLLDEYDVQVDKKIFETLIEIYAKRQDKNFVAPQLLHELETTDGSYAAFTNRVYSQQNLYNRDSLNALFAKPAEEAIAQIGKFDAINLFKSLQVTYQQNVQQKLNEYQAQINKFQRLYTKGQLEVMKEKKFYPDANSTLRVTYGQVKGYNPRDGVYYNYYSTLDGLMQKYVPGDYEFDVPEKLRQLYATKDYGIYGHNGVMPVCFIASNHTTGGNSGSPVLDAYGNLIGLNFDRVWEGTMSDINYDASICRNIMVDIRYVLFIVDKYAGATHLIKEMSLVKAR
ncbi:MAG TPA: serine protease [Chitinophagaceae bacterium]|nr:serine protease [Chitinophagaceae bacterium]